MIRFFLSLTTGFSKAVRMGGWPVNQKHGIRGTFPRRRNLLGGRQRARKTQLPAR